MTHPFESNRIGPVSNTQCAQTGRVTVAAYRTRPCTSSPTTPKPANDRWLKRHLNLRFHSTPTRASYQMEIWFSILEAKSLHGASFPPVKQLRQHIDAFIESYNQHAKPFAGTKAKVHQRRLKPRFADQ
jgi:hypothetical protein